MIPITEECNQCYECGNDDITIEHKLIHYIDCSIHSVCVACLEKIIENE